MSARSKDNSVERVSVCDANQGFSKLIARVEAGARFVVTKNNRAVARIEPADNECEAEATRRRAAVARLEDLMNSGRRTKGGWTFGRRRGALHSRST